MLSVAWHGGREGRGEGENEMKADWKKQFALWVMLEIKKYLREWEKEYCISVYFDKMKKKKMKNFCKRLQSFICLPLHSFSCLSISAEVSLSFKWIVVSVCLLNYDCKLSITSISLYCNHIWDFFPLSVYYFFSSSSFMCSCLYNGTLTLLYILPATYCCVSIYSHSSWI